MSQAFAGQPSDLEVLTRPELPRQQCEFLQLGDGGFGSPFRHGTHPRQTTDMDGYRFR